jgi:large-conductance mechanosensitive channel
MHAAQLDSMLQRDSQAQMILNLLKIRYGQFLDSKEAFVVVVVVVVVQNKAKDKKKKTQQNSRRASQKTTKADEGMEVG